MKKFLIKIVFLFLGVFIIDFTLGKALEYILANAKGGSTQRDNYICNELTCDVLLLGSSRCEHHYNPIIISDSLGKTCYNAGQAGNGIIVAYARYLMICQRKKPHYLVYDVNPEFDLLKVYDNHRYLTWLKSYYDKDYVKEIFDLVDKTEKYKMTSSLYRYNSHFIEVLIDYFHPVSDSGIYGYEPLNGELDRNKIAINKSDDIPKQYAFDPLKFSYIEKLINLAGKDNIVLTISPRWYGMDKESYKPLEDYCRRKDVLFIDFANNPKYTHNDQFFKDGSHLNARGADVFTVDLIKLIKDNIK